MATSLLNSRLRAPAPPRSLPVVRRGRAPRRRRVQTEDRARRRCPSTSTTATTPSCSRDVVITQGDMRIQAAEAQRATGGLDFENSQLDVLRRRAHQGRGRQPAVRQGRGRRSATTSSRSATDHRHARASSSSSARTAPRRAAAPTPSTTKPAAAPCSLREQCLADRRLQRDQRPAAGLQHQARSSVQGQPTPTAPAADGRIVITIQPKASPEAEPCAKPGTEAKP